MKDKLQKITEKIEMIVLILTCISIFTFFK